MAELNIGKHCAFENCHQLDFLPFECAYCKLIYCLHHKFQDAHHCSKFEESNSTETYTGTKSYICEVPDCPRRELMEVICEQCKKNFCLHHRHQQEHSCPKLVVKETPTKTAEHVQKIIDSKKAEPLKRPRSKKASKTAAKVALMKMKMKAEGDKGVPEADRIFLHTYLPRGNSPKSKAIFYSKSWTIGRVIDYAANSAGITNLNNTGSEKKLRLFSGDEGNILRIDSILEELIADDTVINGGNVILEHVTENCGSIENINDYISNK